MTRTGLILQRINFFKHKQLQLFTSCRKFDPDVIASIEVDKVQILPMDGDEYCIIESVTKCLQNVGKHINKSVLLNKIQEKILSQIGYYKQFNYIKNGVYESDNW